MLEWSEVHNFVRRGNFFYCEDCPGDVRLHFLPGKNNQPRLQCLCCGRKVDIGLNLEEAIREISNGKV